MSGWSRDGEELIRFVCAIILENGKVGISLTNGHGGHGGLGGHGGHGGLGGHGGHSGYVGLCWISKVNQYPVSSFCLNFCHKLQK